MSEVRNATETTRDYVMSALRNKKNMGTRWHMKGDRYFPGPDYDSDELFEREPRADASVRPGISGDAHDGATPVTNPPLPSPEMMPPPPLPSSPSNIFVLRGRIGHQGRGACRG